MEIRTFGTGERLRECCARLLLYKDELPIKELLLLPIPTTRDKKYITATDTPLSEIEGLCHEGVFVAGYGIPKEQVSAAESRGARVYDAARDKDFLKKNADITARGALGRLLTDTKKDITDMKIGIIGYGRIGKELTRLCLFLGASVTVYTKRAEVCADLLAAGIDSQIITSECDLSKNDVIFNTAPEAIIRAELIASLPEKTSIVDLASGNIFEPSERLLKLASIPDAMYPITAGRVYAEAIIGAIYGRCYE